MFKVLANKIRNDTEESKIIVKKVGKREKQAVNKDSNEVGTTTGY